MIEHLHRTVVYIAVTIGEFLDRVCKIKQTRSINLSRSNNRLIRPTAEYIGPEPKPFVPMETRSGT